MGCTASSTNTVVTTVEGKSGKPTLVSKKPLPPIGAAEAAKPDSATTRSKVDPLPDISVKTGKVTNNVAFEITLEENHIDNIVKRAPPKRLKRLEPIQATLTTEQLEEKQRLAEAKRNKIKQNIRLKSARASRRRSDLQKALDAAKAQEADDADDTQPEPASNPTEQAENPAVATPRPAGALLTSRVAQQVDKMPRLNEQPTQDEQIKANVKPLLDLENERPLRSASTLMALDNAGATTERQIMSDRLVSTTIKNGDLPARRPGTPIESLSKSRMNTMPLSSRSEVLQKSDVQRARESEQLSRGATEDLTAKVSEKKKGLDSDVEDEEADLGVGLHDKKDGSDSKLSSASASASADAAARLGSAESGFLSNAHSAEASGKKPLKESEIEAFKAAKPAASPVPASAKSPEPLSSIKKRNFDSDDESDHETFVHSNATPRAGDEPRAPSIKDEDDDIF